MSAPYDPGLPRWDPTMEVFPGGPHPGAVAQMHAEAAAREQQARAFARSQRQRSSITCCCCDKRTLGVHAGQLDLLHRYEEDRCRIRWDGRTKRTWKHEFKIARAEETEAALAWSSDDADDDAETTSLLEVLNKLGGEGCEMISESTPESTIISRQYGWSEVGVPVLYRWMLKRRVGSSLSTTEE